MFEEKETLLLALVFLLLLLVLIVIMFHSTHKISFQSDIHHSQNEYEKLTIAGSGTSHFFEIVIRRKSCHQFPCHSRISLE